MKMTINKYDFAREFHNMNRNNFSKEALYILFDYFDEIDENFDLDVIAICCEYCEATPIEIADMYNIDLPDINGLDENEAYEALFLVVSEWLSFECVFIGSTSDKTIIFQNI